MLATTGIVCPHCFVTNRVPDARVADASTCGKCHLPLFTGKPTAVNLAQFQKMLQFNDTPLIVDFWAEWCGPCKMFAPTFAQASGQLEPRFRLLKVDTEANQEIAANYRIQSIPTLALFKQGKESARQAGAMSLSQFMAWVESQA
ncbi:thioredoxin TrxC [Pseudomonadales bacterium]|nr:thioredoxin TrxC [Pseudomonadales bacterium]